MIHLDPFRTGNPSCENVCEGSSGAGRVPPGLEVPGVTKSDAEFGTYADDTQVLTREAHPGAHRRLHGAHVLGALISAIVESQPAADSTVAEANTAQAESQGMPGIQTA